MAIRFLKKLSFYDQMFLGLIVFHVVFYAIFRYLYTAAETFDSAGHLALALKFGNLYKGFMVGERTTLYDILTTSFYYPPLMHWVGGILVLIFGKSINVLLYLVYFTFLGCLVMIRKVVLELGFDEKIAFYAAFFYSFFPFVANQSRLFHTDTAMIFFLLICCYCLLKGKGFSSFKYTILFFIFAAFGMLVRWFVPFFLAVPVLYSFYISVIKAKAFKKTFFQLALGSIIFFLISLPWYIANFELLRLVSGFFAQGEKDDPQVFLSFQNLTYYVRDVISFQVTLVPNILFLIGFYKFYKQNKEKGTLFLAQFVLIYTIFTLIKNKNGRYALALLPLVALFSSYGFSFVTKTRMKVFVILTVILAFMYTSFNRTVPFTSKARAWAFSLTGVWGGGFYEHPEIFSYRKMGFDVGTLVQKINLYAREYDIKPVGVIYTIDTDDVSSANLELMRAYYGYEDIYFATPYFRNESFSSDYEIIKYFRDHDISFVLDSDFQGYENHRHYETMVQFHDFMKREGYKWFELLETVKYPMGDIRIYKRLSFGQDLPIDECAMVYSVDGVVSKELDPLASFVFFTGAFDYGGTRRGFEPGATRILVINNYDTYPKMVDVSGLGERVSMCHRMGTQIKITAEIAEPLIDANSDCSGQPCTKIITTIYGMNGVFDEKIYTASDFEGSGMQALAKKMRFIPYYTETYSLKRDIIEGLKD